MYQKPTYEELEQRVKGLENDYLAHKRRESELQESGDKYRQIVENVNVGILVVQDLKIVFANSTVSGVLGYTQNEILNNLNPFEYVHPDDMGMVLDRHLKKIESDAEIPDVNSFRVVTRSGGILWVEATGVRINWGGKPAILNFLMDITNRRKTEEALKQSNDLLNNIMSASPIAIGLIENRELQWVNQEMISMFRFESKEDYEGKNSKKFYATKKDYHRFGKEFYSKLESGKPTESDVMFKRKDGTTFSGHIKMSCQDSSNPMKRAVFSVSDITWRKQIEEEKEKLINELQTALAEVKTLHGIIPICANCKKIKDDEGYWQRVEKYIQNRSDALFSHGICSECVKELYPDIENHDD